MIRNPYGSMKSKKETFAGRAHPTTAPTHVNEGGRMEIGTPPSTSFQNKNQIDVLSLKPKKSKRITTRFTQKPGQLNQRSDRRNGTLVQNSHSTPFLRPHQPFHKLETFLFFLPKASRGRIGGRRLPETRQSVFAYRIRTGRKHRFSTLYARMYERRPRSD